MERQYLFISRVIPLGIVFLFFAFSCNYYLSVHILPGYSLYDIKRILEVGLITLTMISLLFSPALQKACVQSYCRIPTLTHVSIAVFFVLGTISAIVAPITQMALVEVSLYWLLFFFIIFIAAQHQFWSTHYNKIMLSIIIVTTLFYLAALIPAYFHQFVKAHSIKFLFPGFMNTRFFAQYQVWTLPLILLPSLSFKRSWPVIVGCIVLTALWWALAIANGSNGLVFSLLLAYLFTLIYFRRAAVSWLSLQIISALAGLAIIFLFSLWLHSISHPIILSPAKWTIVTNTSVSNLGHLKTALQDRLLLWQNTLHFILQKPWLGVGPMHLAHYPIGRNTHPHNTLLLIAAEWGIPACFIALSLYLYGTYHWLKGISVTPTTLSLTAAWLAGSCYSLVSGIIVMPVSQIMLCFIAGWMLGVYQQTNKKIVPNGSIHKSIFFVLSIVALSVLIWNVSTQMQQLSQKEISWLLTHGRNVGFSPRFWLQGWI